MFNLYGSAWSQGRRTYAPVRTPSGALSGVPVNGNGNGGGEDGEGGSAGSGVEGGVRPSDCHRLLQDDRAAAAGEGQGGEEEESR